MNLLQLILKQMRQRALSTWLTLLSVLLGVALATAIMLVRRESEKLFGQTDYGFDVLVGAKGSPLQLVLNTVYNIDKSPGNIPYEIYEETQRGGQYFPMSRIAIPIAVGDSYKGQRIIGTTPQLFGVDDEGQPLPVDRVLEYRPGKRYEIAQGRVFHPRKFEAIIGSDIPRITGLHLGGQFQATHGLPAPNQTPDMHEEKWTVVGVLKPTKTAADRALYIPLTSFYCIFEHEQALGAQATLRSGGTVDDLNKAATKPDDAKHDHEGRQYHLHEDGTIELTLPKDEWAISAILVRTRSFFVAQQMMYAINNQNQAAAVNPAGVMREFFKVFLDPSTKAWQGVAMLVNVVAIVAILVSIYNSVAARMRDIAILRALGATRARILTIICAEAGLVGFVGGAIGVVLGHGIAAIASKYLEASIGESLRWWVVGRDELLYLLAVTAVAVLAGLVPALKAYRTPVAANLVVA